MPDNMIDQILARLDDGRLWQKGDDGNWRDLDQPTCLYGALFFIYGRCSGRLPREVHDVITEQFPAQPRANSPVEFNDHDDTTWPEMRMVLEKASVLYDEHHPA